MARPEKAAVRLQEWRSAGKCVLCGGGHRRRGRTCVVCWAVDSRCVAAPFDYPTM